jgi:environmental stress-induced protein Ves
MEKRRGTTREIAVFPPGAGMDDFIWRLSMATVEQAGPFSAFPGIERVLAVLNGRLSLVGEDLHAELDAASAPLCFDAALPVHGTRSAARCAISTPWSGAAPARCRWSAWPTGLW